MVKQGNDYNIYKIDLPDPIKESLKKSGIKKLNPVQVASIKAGVLEHINLVVASPTASGKTLVAEFAFLKNFAQGKGKTVYIVPLRALATEKFDEFKNKYENLGIKIAVSTGDYDSAEDWLGSYDLIICTSEKMDSLLRHNAKWIQDISLVIADEIHLMNDVSRGPTLEMVLTRLNQITNPQIIALSATISNAEDISKWLNAELVQSDYRPIPLEKGVYHPSVVKFWGQDGFERDIKIESNGAPGEIVLSSNTISMNKQALVFVSTRRSAEASAEKISNHVSRFLSTEEKQKLNELAEKILKAASYPTKQCKRLAKIIRQGVAFHHAGLLGKQRKEIENAFRYGLIKIMTATPTLAYGMNLPAFRVLIRDVKRYSGSYGSSYIPVLEIEQFCGRAGRPKYDKRGEAIILAKTEQEAEELKQRYIFGDPEPIYSKLSVDPVLRMHTLALISTQACKNEATLLDFFEKTFFGYQYGSAENIENKIAKILNELESFGFIRIRGKSFIKKDFVPAFKLVGQRNRKFEATKIGKRVSQLYIDPVTAKNIIDRIEEMTKKFRHRDPLDLTIIDMIADCSELYPRMNLRNKEYADVQDALVKAEPYLVRTVPQIWNINYDSFLESFKNTMMFMDWMNELGEDKILDIYGIPPGTLYRKITNAEWLIYAASELAKLLDIKNKRHIISLFNRTSIRLKHGVKEELLQLTRIRGIGRVRARKLFRAGYKTPADLKKASKDDLAKVLSPGIAENIKNWFCVKKTESGPC